MFIRKYKYGRVLTRSAAVIMAAGLNMVQLGDGLHVAAATESTSGDLENLQTDGVPVVVKQHSYRGLFAGALLSDNYLECLEQARLERKALECEQVMAMTQEPLNPYSEIQLSEEDYAALERIVQAEAGGEEEKGKILVAQVILNRVLDENFAGTVYETIFEKIGGSAQFSPTVDGRYYSVTVTEESQRAVEKAISGEDFSQGALYFSARSHANPNDMEWFDRNLKRLFQYGGHEFYTLP